jgi:hypothetical protein
MTKSELQFALAEATETTKSTGRENGNHAASSQDLDWINFARNALGGDLNRLPEVMEHWRKTGANIKHVTAREAVEEFIRWRLAQNSLSPTPCATFRVA